MSNQGWPHNVQIAGKDFSFGDDTSLAWLRLTEIASALEAIQVETQESFESANSQLTHSDRRSGYRTCVLDTQDNISNLQLRIANEIKSLETN